MNNTFFKQSFRLFRKNKLFSLVNILGLSISVALVFLLFIYISTEKNVDSFHLNANKIYRIERANECAFSPPFGQYVVDNIDGVESYCRTFVLEATLKSEYNLQKSPNCFYTDENFFEMFSFRLLKGEPNSALAAKNNIVLSKRFSKVMFPNVDPIGQIVRLNNRMDYIVAGIVDDFDEHTHFKQADVILPFKAFADFWANPGYLSQYDLHFFLPSLYVKAADGINLADKGDELYTKAKSWYWLFQEGESNHVVFQPLKKAYFNPVEYGFPAGARSGNKQLFHFIMTIVIGVIFIATLNFINLTITYSIKRKNEIRIKKIIGAQKQHIIIQSLIETSILFIISLLIAAILGSFILPIFNQLTGYHVTILQLFDNDHWISVIAFLSVFFIFSALIPAIYITTNTPSSISSNPSHKIKRSYIQQSLVVLQFTIAIVLMVSMITMLKQNRFLKNYPVGFNKDETFYIKLNSDIKNKKIEFKEELKKIAGVKSASLCNGMPGVGIMALRFEANNKTQSIDNLNIDNDYFDVMDIHLKKPILPDENSCWINESAAQSLAYHPDDKIITIEEYGGKRTYLVNEVLPDMNFHSLYQKVSPAIFTKINTDGWVDYILVKANTSNIQHIIANAEKIYKKFSPNFPFDFSFLNLQINKAYERETRTSDIVKWFSLFAILISTMGLFAMAVFAGNMRTKEIGIRKVNGAKISEVMIMLNSDFVKWVVIAFVIATPIAYYAMHRWLESFAYKTELSWWIFALAGLLALGIALLTVSWQNWRAATNNPVEALKYE